MLVHGHYDSWDVGVGDNATGDATLLEIARVLWKNREKLKRSVRIAWWPGHSTGRYAGSTWFADTFAHRPRRELRGAGQLRQARLPLGDEVQGRLVDVGDGELRAVGASRTCDRAGEPWRAAAPRGRLCVQQYRHLQLLHAVLDDAGRAARREGLLRRSAAAAATSPGTPRTTRSRSPTRTSCCATSRSTWPRCWASRTPRSCRSTGGPRRRSSQGASTSTRRRRRTCSILRPPARPRRIRGGAREILARRRQVRSAPSTANAVITGLARILVPINFTRRGALPA